MKDKLMGIRNKVKEGIADTEHTISNIDAFGKGMREAGQKVANTFRTFADREEVDYSGQKKVYESMILRLDASIDKVEDLARDVEINRMKDRQVETADRADSSLQEATPIFAVAEPTEEYRYGAEAFEAACAKMDTGKAIDGKVLNTKTHVGPKTGKGR